MTDEHPNSAETDSIQSPRARTVATVLATKYAVALGISQEDAYRYFIASENSERLSSLLKVETELGKELEHTLAGEGKKNPSIIGIGAAADIVHFAGATTKNIMLKAFITKISYMVVITACFIVLLEWASWKVTAFIDQVDDKTHGLIQEIHSDKLRQSRAETPEIYCAIVSRLSDGNTECDPSKFSQ